MTTNAQTDETAILDPGCTSNFLSAAALCSDKQAAHVPDQRKYAQWYDNTIVTHL
jgi:hypothetical protein